MNRIAYIGVDGNLYSVSPDGSDQRRVAGEVEVAAQPVRVMPVQMTRQPDPVFYTWPTWSPDGRKLAVSRVTIEGPSSIDVRLHSITLATGAAIQLYQNPAGVAPIIAPGVPHYMYWSPDSNRLAFLAQGPQGQTLFVSPVDDPARLGTVISGAPLYLAWSTGNRFLLLHVGQDMLLSDVTTFEQPRDLGARSPVFRAPAWSPGGAKMAYIDDDPEGGNALFVADVDGQNGRPIAPVGDSVAFLWSPSRDWIALVETDGASYPVYKGLKVVELEDGTVRTLTDEGVLSFFWSPDGGTIAYVAFDPSAGHLTWKVVDPEGGQPRKLADFTPTNELLTMMTFFDQYAYSNSLWSPDSRHLVFSGQLVSAGDDSGNSLDGFQVYVIDIDSPGSPKAIAEGSVAFWSWN